MEHGSEMLQKQDHDTRLQTMTCAIHLPAVQQLALARTAGCAYQLKRSLSNKKKRIQRRLVSGTCQVAWSCGQVFARGYLSAQCLRASSTSLRERSALFSARSEDTLVVQ